MADRDAEPSAVAGARRGEQAAWEELYRGVYPRLRAYLARRVGAGEAEDAVSETMSRAVAGIDRYRPGPAGFDGWVFGIARHVAAEHARRRARRPAPVGALVGEPSAGPAELVEAKEERRALRRAFDRLPEREREILELRVVAGLSAEQVATVIGKRPGAVRTAQSRALGHLRSLVESGGG